MKKIAIMFFASFLFVGAAAFAAGPEACPLLRNSSRTLHPDDSRVLPESASVRAAPATVRSGNVGTGK